MSVFVTRPISAVFIFLCVLLIGSQIYIRLRSKGPGREIVDIPAPTVPQSAAE
jgi:hypothetical protein